MNRIYRKLYYSLVRHVAWLLLGVALWSPIGFCSAYAVTPQDLIDQQQLSVTARIEPQQNIVVGQEVSIFIEIKTNRWFTGGTRLSLPEISRAVVTQRETLAVNNTETIGGEAWTTQRWEISVFPQDAGEFVFPAMALKIFVNSKEYGEVSGFVTTSPIGFEANYPVALVNNNNVLNIDNWFAATELSLIREIDDSNFTGQGGQSLRIEVTTKAEKTLAMMLPVFTIPEQAGIAIYPQTPQLQDLNQRGARTAVRQDIIDIVVEQNGTYFLPGITRTWWDTTSNQLQTVALPALKIVSGEGVLDVDADEEIVFAQPQSPRTIYALAAIGVIAGLLSIGLIMFWMNKRAQRDNALSEAKILKNIRRAERGGDWAACVHWLYYWLDHFSHSSTDYGLRDCLDVDSLLAYVYSQSKLQQPANKISFLKQLRAQRPVRDSLFRRWRFSKSELDINP